MKYVALLAFNKIVVTHPWLVAQQEDVILECIDSSDITIRIQALDLVQGMVTADNLVSIVSRLMKQLKSSMPVNDNLQSGAASNAQSFDSDDEAQEAINAASKTPNQAPPLPEDYRIDVISRILFMSSKDNYANITDFDWYIDVLTQLIRMVPVARSVEDEDATLTKKSASSAAQKVGDELRNVAVKVRAMRSTAVRAAEDILAQQIADTPSGHSIKSDALRSVTWVLGEYAVLLTRSDETLNGMLQLLSRAGRPEISTIALHAVAKVFASIAGDDTAPWTSERKSRISLLMARMLHSIEPLALHPNLEVQERAVEFIELLKLTAEAASGQPASTDEEHQDAPLLLTQAIPSLFNSWELNSVAAGAQFNVPVPDGLDLDAPIHSDLNSLLAQADIVVLDAEEADEFEIYYNQRPAPTSISSSAPAISRITEPEEDYSGSYQQQPTEESYMDADIVARRKAERLERNKDDPFFLGGPDTQEIPTSQNSASIHNILQTSNGPDLDIDAIPIMQLDLEKHSSAAPAPAAPPKPKPRQKIVIASDENLGDARYDSENNNSDAAARRKKLSKGLLQVDSSTIGSFNLEGPPVDHDREDREMQAAVKEVERLRLEMQRANERIQVAQGVDVEGAVVKKKKKVKRGEDGSVVKKKKKPVEGVGDGEAVVKKKKKKKVAQIEE